MLKRLILSASVEGLNSEIKKPHVIFEHCNNRIQKKYPCHICLDHCPTGAITYDKQLRINRDNCIGCYLCSGSCPTGCISTHPNFIKSNKTTETLVVSCEAGGNRLKVPCLASLPWSAYAYLSHKSSICLDTTRCGDCQVSVNNTIELIKERLKIFWGSEYEEKILYDPNRLTQTLSRRDFFALFAKPIKNAKESIETPAVTMDDRKKNPFHRQLVKNLNPGKVHGWLVPHVEGGCWGCHVCEKICPNEAIKVSDDTISFNALDCISCQLCVKTCPEKVISVTIRQLTKENPVVSFPIQDKRRNKARNRQE